MYEQVRIRAQVFEVRKGGHLNTDSPEGTEEPTGMEGASMSLAFTPLPQSMVDELRVRLDVWR